VIDFSDRISDGGWIDTMRSEASQQIAFARLRDALPKLGVAAAANLRIFFDDLVRGESPFVNAMKKLVGEEIAEARERLDEIAVETEYWSPPKKLVALSASQRNEYAERIRDEFRALENQIAPLFALEERFWKFDPASKDPIIDYALRTSVLGRTPRIAVRRRTQLRLAALHCRIIEFKRTYNRWPNALTELGGRDVWYDPASGGPFFYARLSDQSYTLYSRGTPETGRIDLAWRPQQSEGDRN
jgi:hypothetical protein